MEGRRGRQPSPEASREDKVENICSEPQGKERNSSSEFGDDDFNEDFLELAEASMDPFVDHNSHIGAVETRQSAIFTPSTNHEVLETPQFDPTTSKPEENMNDKENYTLDADEFDDEFDEFSDSIEDILAECDAAPNSMLVRPISKPNLVSDLSVTGADTDSSSTATVHPAQEVNRPQGESSGDEFDDDEFDMEAIEQSMRQSGADGSNHVCHS
jgi:hypothetical protein